MPPTHCLSFLSFNTRIAAGSFFLPLDCRLSFPARNKKGNFRGVCTKGAIFSLLLAGANPLNEDGLLVVLILMGFNLPLLPGTTALEY